MGLEFRALQPGWSTVTFNYQFQETGTVPVGNILTAFSGISANFFGYSIDQSRQIQTTVPVDQSLNIARTITGIFTGSAFFGIGGGSELLVVSEASARAVPGPETFWLLLGGLATLVVWRDFLSKQL
jgi:hypothetical protein